ncbi:MAG: 23S rRNA (uracil(1939)-C(5))-methyltransferase RlmD [Oscillospiraceae bacterium]|nr:23S rRNA (uracil(1939)-C(5))-methyltransferase RlmD [Oscillospiraceae bacterium]
MKKNDLIELTVTGMTLQGDGVARHGGVPVFVPGTCPGDDIQALVLKAKPNCAFGKCVKILEASPRRVDPGCEAFPRCGGCAFRHIEYQEELAVKQREAGEALRRIGGVELEPEPILGAQEPERYRNKALLPVHMEQGRVRAGYYARHSHRVVYSEDCKLQPALFHRLARAVCAWAEEAGCGVYDEGTHTGLLRHIYLRQAQRGRQILVCLVINGQGVPRADLLISRLRGESAAVRGILLNHNREDTNVALGRSETLLWGEGHIAETLCGLEFTLSPRSFFQVNPAQAERLYRLAGEFAGLAGHERVLDLYCGTGTIGLTMARGCAELVGVESVPQAVEDARRNAARNGIANARFLCMDAARAAAQLAGEGWRPDVVLLDPPRRGCDPAVLRAVAEMAPGRVVYISCDPATLARDLKLLRETGYEARRVTPVDMFPRTGHVEIIALLGK